ncbi:hypothetical protein [Thiomicrospira sp. S5]
MCANNRPTYSGSCKAA